MPAPAPAPIRSAPEERAWEPFRCSGCGHHLLELDPQRENGLRVKCKWCRTLWEIDGHTFRRIVAT